MALPKINLSDGRHKLIVAEDGERVLTPQQNKEYEATHPNARKHPMLAKIGGETAGLFDATADVSAAPEIGMGAPRQLDTVPGDTTARAPSAPKAKRDTGDIDFNVQPDANTKSVTSPLLNQEAFDKGGTVQPSITDRIKSRAVDLYNQGKALLAPMDNEAEALKLKQQNIDEATQMKPFVAAPTSTPAAKPNPAGAYGTRPGEKRPEDLFRPQAGTPLGKAYDCGGRIEVYDESGVVSTDEEHDDPAKEAAYHQAAAEVHAEEAEKLSNPSGERRVIREAAPDSQEEHGAPADFNGPVFPNPKGIKVRGDTEQEAPDYNMKTGKMMSADNYTGGKPTMNMENTPSDMDDHIISEASNKSPLGNTGAPRSSAMKTLPGIESPRGNGTTDVPYTPEVGEADAVAAGGKVNKLDPKMALIEKDKEDAARRGHEGLSDLGLAMIHENAFKKDSPDLGAPTTAIPKYAGPGKPVPAGQPIPAKQLLEDEFKAKRLDYDKRIQAAMDLGTPEGDREAASLGLAKQHFDKMNPYGSPANHPGVLGKIEHGLAKAGNIAGNIVAPETMALIPGTELNKGVTTGKLMGQEQAATKESLEQAQAKAATLGSKLPPLTQVYDRSLQEINPETTQGGPKFDPKFPQGRNNTPLEALEIAQDPGKGAETTYARNYMKDHPGAKYEDGINEYNKMQAGNKLNEHQKRVADWVVFPQHGRYSSKPRDSPCSYRES